MTADDEPTPTLIRERRVNTLVLTLNRPQVRNAVDAELARALAAGLDELEDDDALRVGVITGAAGTFCSGMDLAAFLRGEPREVEGRGFAGVTEATRTKPLIAAVEGAALAGGFELALACDLIVAARDARFGLPEVRRGLIAGSGGLLRLVRRIPPQLALEHALTGEPISGEEAHRLGLTSRLVAPGEALDAALELAARIGEAAPLAVRATKELADLAVAWPGPEAWDRQRARLETVIASDDAREGAEAFLQRRPPQWRGR